MVTNLSQFILPMFYELDHDPKTGDQPCLWGYDCDSYPNYRRPSLHVNWIRAPVIDEPHVNVTSRSTSVEFIFHMSILLEIPEHMHACVTSF